MMSPIPNFFYVNRDLLNSDRWLSEQFTRGQAWVDLFGLAQFEKGFFRIRGIKIEVERGQLAYSQQTLARRWQWSRGKLRRFLKELENNGDIVQQNNEVTTLITIVKYDLWQGSSTSNGTTDGHQTVQQTDIKRYTYNKDNKENNDKNDKNIISACIEPSTKCLQNVNNLSPVEFSKSFFLNSEPIIVELIKSGLPESLVRTEINKFKNYWTERNSVGKQRWEIESVFEVKNRLRVWFRKVQDHKPNNSSAPKAVRIS